jgi:hypothetical protein
MFGFAGDPSSNKTFPERKIGVDKLVEGDVLRGKLLGLLLVVGSGDRLGAVLGAVVPVDGEPPPFCASAGTVLAATQTANARNKRRLIQIRRMEPPNRGLSIPHFDLA